MPLFSRSKSPKDIVIHLRENLLILNSSNRSEKDRAKALSEVSRQLNALKDQISASISTSNSSTAKSDASDSTNDGGGSGSSGVAGGDPNSLPSGSGGIRGNEVLIETGAELQNNDTLYLLLSLLDHIDFEASKCVSDIFCLLLHRQVGETRRPMITYLCQPANIKILSLFLTGSEKPEYAIQYGTMLREVARHEELTKLLLELPEFYRLFGYAQGTAFDVSSDAFHSLRDLLSRHKGLVSKYLEQNYDTFFHHFHSMINCSNYATKRQALKLLSELLLERANFTIMKRYIDEPENLKLIMNLLKVQEKQIAFEAFHCFKVFVANPNKERQVHSILFVNRDKLVDFLQNFLLERSEDNQFKDEKGYLIKTIKDMKPFSPPSSSNTPAASVARTA